MAVGDASAMMYFYLRQSLPYERRMAVMEFQLRNFQVSCDMYVVQSFDSGIMVSSLSVFSFWQYMYA